MKVVKVRFRNAGKAYDFDSSHLGLEVGDKVIVKTEKGLSLGTVVSGPIEEEDRGKTAGIKKVIRKATSVDFSQEIMNSELEKVAYDYCLQQIKKLGLPMKLVQVECLFDKSRLIFYFTAEGRVDFRELVKILVKRFRTRIEMRQIGVRHEAKMMGGIGNCGRIVCCASFLTSFDPVSVRMAKDQNLSLNPAKISGICGRLMCCLAFEHPLYAEARTSLPKCGKKVKTIYGEGEVVKVDVLGKRLTVKMSEGKEVELGPKELIMDEKQNGVGKAEEVGEEKDVEEWEEN